MKTKFVIGPPGLKEIEKIKARLEDDPRNPELRAKLQWWLDFKDRVEGD